MLGRSKGWDSLVENRFSLQQKIANTERRDRRDNDQHAVDVGAKEVGREDVGDSLQGPDDEYGQAGTDHHHELLFEVDSIVGLPQKVAEDNECEQVDDRRGHDEGHDRAKTDDHIPTFFVFQRAQSSKKLLKGYDVNGDGRVWWNTTPMQQIIQKATKPT